MNKRNKLHLVENKSYRNINAIFNDMEYVKEKLSFEDYIYCLIPSLVSAGLVFIIMSFTMSFFLLLIEDSIDSILLVFFFLFYAGFLTEEKNKKQISLEINSILFKKANEMHPIENVFDIHEYKEAFLSQKKLVFSKK
jgi:hypothetical protein